MTFVGGEFKANSYSFRRLEVDLDNYSPFIRVGIDIDAGTWWATSYVALLGDPIVAPPDITLLS